MTVLLLVYKIFLEREKIHRFNRFYLLFSVVFSLTLPFLSYSTQTTGDLVKNINQLPQVFLQEVTVSEKVQSFAYEQWLITAYSLITLILIIRFAYNIRSFNKKIKNYKTVKYNNAILVLLPYNVLPHTFLKYIFINEDDYNENALEKDLYTHELAHVNQKHTLDILFIEIIKTIFWFNPLLYFFKRTIQLNHEFLADEAVITINKDTAGYQSLLLQITSGDSVALASNINFSITKKRFIMMTKTTPRLLAISKQLLLLPVLAGLFFISCAENDINKNNEDASSREPEQITIPENEAPPAAEGKVYNAGGLTKQPEYPGGMGEFYRHVSKNFNIPEVRGEEMAAKIMVSFVVETDGTMSDIKVLRDPGYGMGDEALRVLKTITEKWTPGEMNGEKVRTSFALPITINVKA